MKDCIFLNFFWYVVILNLYIRWYLVLFLILCINLLILFFLLGVLYLLENFVFNLLVLEIDMVFGSKYLFFLRKNLFLYFFVFFCIWRNMIINWLVSLYRWVMCCWFLLLISKMIGKFVFLKRVLIFWSKDWIVYFVFVFIWI